MNATDRNKAAAAIKSLVIHYQLMCESLDGKTATGYKTWKEEAKKNLDQLSEFGIHVDLLEF
jgi:hypothetical protein